MTHQEKKTRTKVHYQTVIRGLGNLDWQYKIDKKPSEEDDVYRLIIPVEGQNLSFALNLFIIEDELILNVILPFRLSDVSKKNKILDEINKVNNHLNYGSFNLWEDKKIIFYTHRLILMNMILTEEAIEGFIGLSCAELDKYAKDILSLV